MPFYRLTLIPHEVFYSVNEPWHVNDFKRIESSDLKWLLGAEGAQKMSPPQSWGTALSILLF